MQNFSEPAFRVKHPGLTMASLLLGAFVGMFSETSLNIALPKLMIVFHTSTAVLQWLVTGYMLVIGIVLPLSSLIAKWFTTRQIVIFALLDFIIGAAISALAPNFAVLLAGRMIQGIGTGLILPLMFTIVMQIFPPKKIGSIMGICALVIMAWLFWSGNWREPVQSGWLGFLASLRLVCGWDFGIDCLCDSSAETRNADLKSARFQS